MNAMFIFTLMNPVRRTLSPVRLAPIMKVTVTVDVKNAQTKTCELELIQTQMAQKPMLRAEVGMRVRCANKASAE